MSILDSKTEEIQIICDAAKGIIPITDLVRLIKQKGTPINRRISSVALYFREITNNGNGTVHVMRALARILSNRGYKVFVVTESKASDSDMVIECAERLVIPCQRKEQFVNERLSRFYAFYELLDANKIDLVIDNFFHSEMLVWNILAAKWGGVKYVVIDHGYLVSWMNYIEKCFSERFEWLKLADAVVSLTSVQKRLYDCLGIPSKIILNPSDALPISSEFRNRHARKILWVGRFEYEKKPLVAVETFEIISALLPDAELFMVGQGSEEKQLREYVENRQIKNVIFTGFQKGIEKYYIDCDLLLITSEFESWSLVLREAMANGLPTAAFELPNLDVMQDNNGILTVPQDDILSLANTVVDVLSNEKRYMELSRNAITWFREYQGYDFENEWDSFIRIIEKGKADKFIDPVNEEDKRLVLSMIRYHGNGMNRAIAMIEELKPDAAKGRSKAYKIGEKVLKPLRLFIKKH